MFLVGCSIPERLVNPLFEVFDGGDFILSSYRDIEEDFTRMRIYLERRDDLDEATRRLKDALGIVQAETQLEVGEIADEDWKFAYRRHFKIEQVSERIWTVPEWEEEAFKRGEFSVAPDAVKIVLDPGMAFGTGKHETTKACLKFIDRLLKSSSLDNKKTTSLLDMGCGSGILSIAAKKLGCENVRGFDVDQEAVDSSKENAAKNQVEVEFFKYGLGAKVKRDLGTADIVVANILGPLLIRFADEISPCATDKLIISGILSELYPEVREAYLSRGFREIENLTLGEWTTGLLER